MKPIFYLSIIISVFLFISCGNSNQFKTSSKIASYDSFWGNPVDYTPTNEKELAKNWIVKSGNWKVIDGKLEAVKNDKGDSEGHVILFKKNLVGDYAIEFNASITSKEALETGGDLSIIMASDPLLEKRYDLQIGGIGNKYAIIMMYKFSVSKLPYELVSGEVYKIRAEKLGDSLSLYCNDVLLVACKNKYFLTGRLNGIYAYGKGKRFWNIKVYEKKMRNYDIEIVTADRILSKVINFPSKYRRNANIVRSMYNDIHSAYPREVPLNDIINMRLANLELSVNNFKRVEYHLNKVTGKLNKYDILLLKARAAFMQRDFKLAKEYFSLCIKKYKNFRGGTVVSLKDLLHSNYGNNLSAEYQNFFWKLYVQNTHDRKKNLISSHLKSIDFLNETEIVAEKIYFDFKDNEISSLVPLSKYKEIDYLRVSSNKKLTTLKELKNIAIKSLILNDTKISSLDGINRKELIKLDIGNSGLKNLELLKDCLNLKYLDFRFNNLKKIEELKPLESLVSLYLNHNQIEDLTPINFKTIKNLYLGDNLISNIEPIQKAELLVSLDLNNNKIESLEHLSNLEKLNLLLCVNNPLKSLGSFAEKPPKRFYFTIDELDNKYIESLRANWSKEEYELHKMNLDILIELKKGDKANLKQFAVKKRDHYYLSVPVFLNLKDAHKFCKKFGGHLISIVEKFESDEKLIERMGYYHWMGLEEKNNTFKWSTGEYVDVDNVYKIEDDRNTKDRVYAINSFNRWISKPPDTLLPFIIEWDE
ncbi:MAG: hypothetical protein COA79_05035 [Planctomycetota bacterium]|nr:MAG: hypothetical protein COA79_05035 [Planctomycetota bacterium]